MYAFLRDLDLKNFALPNLGDLNLGKFVLDKSGIVNETQARQKIALYRQQSDACLIRKKNHEETAVIQNDTHSSYLPLETYNLSFVSPQGLTQKGIKFSKNNSACFIQTALSVHHVYFNFYIHAPNKPKKTEVKSSILRFEPEKHIKLFQLLRSTTPWVFWKFLNIYYMIDPAAKTFYYLNSVHTICGKDQTFIQNALQTL